MDESRTTILLGGPGCGKTTSLLDVVEQALTSGVKPNKIGFVSFTKKATEEGRNRASERFGIPPEDFPHFRTIHSTAFKYLGIKRDHVLNWRHLKELGRLLGLEFKGRGEVADGDLYGMNDADRLLFLEGLARNTKKPLKTIWNDAGEDSIDWFELERFSRALESFKHSRGLCDYTDMIERFNQSDPRTLPQFDLLIIDEIQDLSPLQWDSIELLASNAKQIYVGGDDCQSIYSWSGADVNRFVQLPGRQINLEQSHRVPKAVHALANSISDRIVNKRPRVWRAKDQPGSVNWFGSIEEIDLSSSTWYLLARNGYMLNELEDYCLSQGFPFRSVGRDPLKSDSLKAIQTWENLRKGLDESAERVLETLKYVEARLVPITLMKQLKSDEPSRMYGMPELQTLGIKTTDIWHRSLTKISPTERDYFIAARKRKEPLLKEPRIHISTIHASKGGEAANVLLLTDMSHRCFENMERNTDDECRVFYVAASRAQESLNILMPRTNLNFEL